jgi:hypothetical protein
MNPLPIIGALVGLSLLFIHPAAGVAAFSSGLDPRLRVVADRFFFLDDFYFEPVLLQTPQAPAGELPRA